MVYCYSRTESFGCGNWNHLVCRKWKCEVDNPSQSTVVNLGKKQKWCSLWCPWSRAQQDTSDPDNFRISVVLGKYIIGVPVSEIEPRCILLLSCWEHTPCFAVLIYGVMSASFHLSGIFPSYIDWLNMMHSICESSVASSFSIFLGMS